jgi:hypothetical protein
VLQSARSDLRYLKGNRGILDLILLLATINFTASMFDATLPALVLSRPEGGHGRVSPVSAGVESIISPHGLLFLPGWRVESKRFLCYDIFIGKEVLPRHCRNRLLKLMTSASGRVIGFFSAFRQ